MATSDWTFYNKNKNEPLLNALNIFVKSLLLNKEDITNEIRINGFKRILINTDGQNDIINTESRYTFLKSRFLTNKKLKQKLIEYYNPIGIFVKGPFDVIKRDGSVQWIIELCRINN
jgi:hypothetical protein